MNATMERQVRHKDARSRANLIGQLEAELMYGPSIERQLAAIAIANKEYWAIMNNL